MSSMALYMIGDVQGCDAALGDLLEKVAFSPSRDRLILLGDLVNRGPASLAVLRRMVALGDAAACLLGNHDLHLLAVSQGVRKPHRSDTVADILAAPDRDALLDWLRHRPLALHEHGVLMVHAGVLPQWTVVQTLVLATEVEKVLQAAEWADFMHQMYGNQPDQWRDGLQGAERLRVIVNALTRLRYCTAQGRMEFDTKAGGLDGARKLIGAGGLLHAARVAGENLNHAIGRSTLDKLRDGLEIAIATAGKLNAQHLAAIVREIEVNIARAYTLRLVVKTNH